MSAQAWSTLILYLGVLAALPAALREGKAVASVTTS